MPKEEAGATEVRLQGGSVAPSLCSEGMAINEGDGISLQNFVISFENTIHHEQCRSSSIEQMLCAELYQ